LKFLNLYKPDQTAQENSARMARVMLLSG